MFIDRLDFAMDLGASNLARSSKVAASSALNRVAASALALIAGLALSGIAPGERTDIAPLSTLINCNSVGDYGYEQTAQGYGWRRAPPGIDIGGKEPETRPGPAARHAKRTGGEKKFRLVSKSHPGEARRRLKHAQECS
ncbi:hypothetical protein QM467_03400 [Rhodoblastus sp. 17X3]|uniref:hypothetical protein n=1 Tax=Rhodoblastus sp. 17X3 TaxID=3047026 RepID=UPI0024B64661|nr:hypothetical protein [Rhodoblastus sp. 17X3]MDI9847105.1 hypothetical protein [Rhodoblastus sp. 17X3]